MASSRVAVDSSKPPVGYDTMPNDQQVRRWLPMDSFRVVEGASEGIEIMCIIMDKYMKVDDEYLLGLENDFRDQKPAADASDLSLRLAAWRSDRKMLESKGVPQSELTQKGSLLKVVSKIPEIQAVMDSVEVMQKGKKLSVAELLDLAGRIGDRAPPKSKSNDNNKNKDKNKDKKTYPASP